MFELFPSPVSTNMSDDDRDDKPCARIIILLCCCSSTADFNFILFSVFDSKEPHFEHSSELEEDMIILLSICFSLSFKSRPRSEHMYCEGCLPNHIAGNKMYYTVPNKYCILPNNFLDNIISQASNK